MPKSPGKTRLTDRKRAAILEAAVEQFESRGYENASMDGIAKVASVSKRTVYNHFASKEELFGEIVRQLMSRCRGSVEKRFDPEIALETQLMDIGRAVIETMASEDSRSLSRVIVSRFLQTPGLAEQFLDDQHTPDSGVAVWIKGAAAAGRIDVPDPVFAAKQFCGLLQAFGFWPQIIGGKPNLTEAEEERVLRTAVRMFLKCYATQDNV